jgi:hypothetical protein
MEGHDTTSGMEGHDTTSGMEGHDTTSGVEGHDTTSGTYEAESGQSWGDTTAQTPDSTQ